VDIIEAARMLRRREVSGTELVRDAFTRADAVDEVTGAYLHRLTEPALRAARRADADLAAGRDRGPLHGIPLAVKDNMFTADGPTTAQSRVHEPPRPSSCIGSGLPISRSKRPSLLGPAAGRSPSRTNTPLLVPPRIRTTRSRASALTGGRPATGRARVARWRRR
jgi:hypothetical protein